MTLQLEQGTGSEMGSLKWGLWIGDYACVLRRESQTRDHNTDRWWS